MPSSSQARFQHELLSKLLGYQGIASLRPKRLRSNNNCVVVTQGFRDEQMNARDTMAVRSPNGRRNSEISEDHVVVTSARIAMPELIIRPIGTNDRDAWRLFGKE